MCMHFASSPTEHTPVLIQRCLRSQMGLLEKYYCAPYAITRFFASDVGCTNIVVWSMGQSGAETECQLCENNVYFVLGG